MLIRRILSFTLLQSKLEFTDDSDLSVYNKIFQYNNNRTLGTDITFF